MEIFSCGLGCCRYIFFIRSLINMPSIFQIVTFFFKWIFQSRGFSIHETNNLFCQPKGIILENEDVNDCSALLSLTGSSSSHISSPSVAFRPPTSVSSQLVVVITRSLNSGPSFVSLIQLESVELEKFFLELESLYCESKTAFRGVVSRTLEIFNFHRSW